MTIYRWNQSDTAAGYDASAELVHPHYTTIQDEILKLLPHGTDDEFLLVDLGGGSGRLAERFLSRFKNARAVVIDQSEGFLELARKRLEPFSGRGECLLLRLQDDWPVRLTRRPSVIVSMSAIHHLDPAEKQVLYARCGNVLADGGVLLNGDEVRPESDADYLAQVQKWAAHMHRVIDSGQIPPAMSQALLGWEERNVQQFGGPRRSGDDCHETMATQLNYFHRAGFSTADAPWQQEMWAVMRGVRGKG
jgi:tRNA (cmo5U34)-methyltransferase